MYKITLIILTTIFCSACAQKSKPEITEVIPPPPNVRIVSLNFRLARVNVKLLSTKKNIGIINIAQKESNVKAEFQLEGLKSGPYEIHLSAAATCKKVQMKKHRDLGQVIADKHGVVKATVEFSNMLAQDMVGKTIVLHTKSKKNPSAVACGVIEKI